MRWSEIFLRSITPPGNRAERVEMLTFLALVTATLWLFNRPYAGIWHDAIVYSLLTARHLHSENFAHELFFVFGSQDDFNFYTPIFAHLVSGFGLDLASRLIVLLGGTLWCLAFAVLGWVFFGFTLPMRCVTLFAATLSLAYSPNADTFVLNENFATARVLTMPLVLLAIAADLQGRRYLSLVLAVLATALHPLLGVWGLLAVLCRRWRPIFLIGGAGFIFVLVFALGSVLDWSALKAMDADWAQLVRYATKDVFLAQLNAGLKLERALFWIFALCLGARLGQARFHTLYALVALMTASAYLLSLLCSYYNPVALIMQAQPWRVLWLTMCIGIFALLDVAWRYARLGRGAVLLFVAGALLLYALQDMAIFLCALIGIFLTIPQAACWRATAFDFANHRPRLMLCAIAALATIVSAKYLLDLEMLGLQLPLHWAERQHTLLGFLIGGGMGVGILLWALVTGIGTARRFSLLLMIPAFAFAVANWDVRSERTRAIESAYLTNTAPIHSFAKYIAPGDVLAWPGREETVWFVLKAAHYASSIQAIGVVFSYDKAQLVKQRLERLAIASILGENSISTGDVAHALSAYRAQIAQAGNNVENIHQYSVSHITSAGVPYLCEDEALDWVVVQNWHGVPAAVSVAPDSFSKTDYSLLRCTDVRRIGHTQ